MEDIAEELGVSVRSLKYSLAIERKLTPEKQEKMCVTPVQLKVDF